MVSMIIPVYNVQQYLKECLDSVCGQDYKDIEIIMVDDGSTDESGKICDDYGQKDSRVRVIHQQNKGLSGARNTALEIVHGEFIMFVDSDDYVATNYVSHMVSLIEQDEDIDIGICRFYNAYEQGAEGISIKECVSKAEKSLLEGKDILPRRFGAHKVYYVLAWNKIYRKNMFSGLRFPEGHTCEDAWISLDLYRKCKKVSCTDEALYYYRIRSGSISNTSSAKWIMAQLEWLNREIAYFMESDSSEDGIYPAQAFVSLMFKNRKKLETKNDIECKQHWHYALNILLHSEKISKIDKMKYYIYRFLYGIGA